MYGAKADGTTDDSDAIQAAIVEAVNQNRILFFPYAEQGYKITKTITFLSGLKNVYFSQFDYNGQIRVSGSGYTAVDIEPTIGARYTNLSVGGSGNTVNGILFEGNVGLCVFDSVRVYNLDGFGFCINNIWDAELRNISVELCGNSENYAFSMNCVEDASGNTETCNQTHITRLQVEQSNIKAIYIDNETLDCLIDNIHSERTIGNGTDYTHYFGGNRTVYNNARIEKSTNVKIRINNFGEFNSLDAPDADVTFGNGNSNAITELKNANVKSLIIDNENAHPHIIGSRMTTLSVIYNTSGAVLDRCCIENIYLEGNSTFATINSSIITGTITSDGGAVSLKANNSSIATIPSMMGGFYLNNCDITNALTTAWGQTIYAQNCTFNSDITLSNDYARFYGDSCHFNGNLLYGAGSSMAAALDSGCTLASDKTIVATWYLNVNQFPYGTKSYNLRPSAGGYAGYINVDGSAKGFGLIQS